MSNKKTLKIKIIIIITILLAILPRGSSSPTNADTNADFFFYKNHRLYSGINKSNINYTEWNYTRNRKQEYHFELCRSLGLPRCAQISPEGGGGSLVLPSP